MSSPTPRHIRIQVLLVQLLANYFASNQIGGTFFALDCQLSADTVRRPDISVFLADRLRQINLDKSPASLAPDIAVEILSPSQTAMDVRRKVRDYLRAGTKEIWLLDDSNGELMIQTKTGILALQGAEVLESSLLPGFSVPVADLLFIE